jgi:hypothetical protein
MANNYRHNWSIRDYKILFAICRGNEKDSHRVSELLKVFPNNRENGLRMMIEKYKYLNGDKEVRDYFKKNVPKKMLRAWQEYIQTHTVAASVWSMCCSFFY